MTRTVVTAEEDEPVSSVAEKLERYRIKRVPVVRNGRLVGIISRANLLHCVGHLQKGVTPAGDSETDMTAAGWPFGAQAIEVEVDEETGNVKVLRVAGG